MNGELRRPRSVTILARLLLAAGSLVGTAPRVLGAEPRVPWTTSHFAGTPDPPLPYTVEPAYPKLKLDSPVGLEPVPGTDRLFVIEVGGKLVSFPNDPTADRADVAIDLAAARPNFGRLYGLAPHPRFAENREVFLCYTLQGTAPDGTRVSRFRASRTEPPVVDPTSEEVVLTFLAGGHNGGCLQFGPDGFLYISTGDATSPTPPDSLDTGQDIGDLLSSILRIDVDRRDPGRAYRVPPDNPFVNLPGARPEVWAFGLRNPWRMSFDRKRGDLWVGDVGWELWELIYRVERGGNYGWSVMEGRQPIRPGSRRGPTPILPPTADHPHSEAASITGGYVYNGKTLKDLVGVYIYGDYQSGKVWGLRHDGQRVVWRGELAETGLRIGSFGEDRAGELYLLEFERTNQIYRLVPNPVQRSAAEFPRTLSASGLFSSTRDHTPAEGVVPYAVNAVSWADGALAERLLAIPGAGRASIDKEGTWRVPEGSVLARTVSVERVAGDPGSRRRVETQVLHLEGGSWRPYSYLWNDEQTDAELVGPDGTTRRFPAQKGGPREPSYRVAARAECVLCHNPWVEARTTVFGRQSASPLGLKTSQLDRKDQLERLERLGIVEGPAIAGRGTRLVDPYDEGAGLDARARSYLEVNCAHCHQFNAGGAATISLASSLDLAKTQTVDARPSQGTFGIDDARIIVPGVPERSILLYRIAKMGSGRMPRVGSHEVDARATRLIADWIGQMPRTAPEPADALSADLRKALDPAVTAAVRSESTRRLLGSTRGALRLLREIDRGAAPETLPREAAALTRDLPGAEVRDLFERFLPESERVKRLGPAIDPEALLAVAGDSERGRRWFFAESAGRCHTCHRVAGNGTAVGPDLDAIGTKYPKRDLLRHILEPSREIDPKYATRTIATTDGQVRTGVLVERNDREVVLRGAKNETLRIPARDVEQEAALTTSLMPEGLLADLTAQQAADLLEFLATRKGP